MAARGSYSARGSRATSAHGQFSGAQSARHSTRFEETRATNDHSTNMGRSSRRSTMQSTKSRTVHARRTELRGGYLVSVPFKTSDKPFKRSIADCPYGSVNPILNGSRAHSRSVYSSSYRPRGGAQSAGASRKAQVPYSVNADRNKLPTQFKRYASPFTSTLKLGHGVPAVAASRRQYMTTSRFAQRSLRRPMQQHVGFTNPGIMAETQRRLRSGAYD